MNHFTTPLDVRRLDADNRWMVLSPFEFHLGSANGPEFVRVDVGFITDFASVPRPLWSIWPPTGQYGKAAVIHDALYLLPYVQHVGGGMRRVNRGEADHIFLEGMEVLGVSWFTRRNLYQGVRALGWHPWKQYRKAEAGERES